MVCAMTEDAPRHYCRNQKCRTRLPAPVTNLRDAFCCAGCHTRFYFRRCIVCERDMPRNAPNQRTCYRAECKKTWRDGRLISRFAGIGRGSDRRALGKPIKSGLKTVDKGDRRWHIVAHPALNPRSLAAATVPDGPGMMWNGGAFEASEAKNRKALDQYFTERTDPPTDDRCAVCGRTDDQKDIRHGNSWTIVCYPCRERGPVPVDFGDLSIPDFLRRQQST
jgi:hypothetical protein